MQKKTNQTKKNRQLKLTPNVTMPKGKEAIPREYH